MPKELLNGVSSKKEIQKVFLFKTQTLNTRDTKKLPSFSSFRYIFLVHTFGERETQERDANGRIRNDLRDGGRRRTRVVAVTVSTTVVFSARGAERTRE